MAGLTRLERVLLPAVAALTALAGVAHYGGWAPVPRFALATAALAGIAWTVEVATEQTGEHVSAAATGVLHATIGNLPELLVVVFALKAGDAVVAETALIGSLLASALLVLGLTIVAGARRAPDGVMRFSPRLANDTTTLLLVTVFLIVLIGLALSSGNAAGRHVEAISAIGAGCLLGVYATWLWTYLRAASPPGGPGRAEAEPARLSLRVAVTLLVVAGLGAGFVSEWFVSALDPAIAVLHISTAFAGLVIVAIAGNAVEHVSSIGLASRGKSDLAVAVVKSSVAQIAAFLYPVLVLFSLALPTHLTFALQPIYIGALGLMTLAVWQVTGDGEAAAFEGWALAAIYVIVAVVAAYQ
jgi:Ca2+:H+ antiporter